MCSSDLFYSRMERCVVGYGAGRAVSARYRFPFLSGYAWMCGVELFLRTPRRESWEREPGAVEQRSSSLARSSWRMPAAAKERVGVAVAVGGSVGGTGYLSINLSSVVIFLDVVVCSVHAVSRFESEPCVGVVDGCRGGRLQVQPAAACHVFLR